MDEENDKTILVYDFGGGTFDASLLRIEDGKIEIIETEGNNLLGGKDITDKLKEFIFEKILDEDENLDMFSKEESGLNQKDYNENLNKIINEAEKVKIDLSEYQDSQVSIANLINNDGTTFNIEFNITRKEFEDEIAEIRKKTIDVVKNLINNSGIDKSEIDEIVMAGGSASIPSIRQSLKDQLGIDTEKSIDTSIVISQGAAVEAIRKFSDDNTVQDKIIYNDTALHDFGIRVKNYNFDVLIPKGSNLPISTTKDYTTVKDNQDTIELEVFQRKSTYPNAKKTYEKDAINKVDKIIIEGIPPSKVNELIIRVTFELTKDDSLEVSVKIFNENNIEQHSENITISKASNV
jgi:molecular chaperone DnaK